MMKKIPYIISRKIKNFYISRRDIMFNLENPFAFLLRFFGDLLGGNFGLSIIVITLLIRFLLLPLFMKQEKQQKQMQVNMQAMMPEMTKLQGKMSKAKTPEAKMAVQKEMFALRKKHNINLSSMGILPVLLQIPILFAFYHALKSTNLLDNQPFLWFDLSANDVLIAVLVGIGYLIQTKLFQQKQPANPQQFEAPRALNYLIPVLMASISLTLPSAIPLYWFIGSLFMICYKLIVKFIAKEKHSN